MILDTETYTEYFLQLEDEKNYFDALVYDNIHYWHYIRYRVFELVRDHMGDLIIYNKNRREKLVDENFEIKLNSIDLFCKRKDVLVFSLTRRVKFGDFYKCVYTDEWLKKFDRSYYVIEDGIGGYFRPVKTKNLRYVNRGKDGKRNRLVEKYYKNNVEKNIEKQVLSLINDIEEKFNIKMSKNQRVIILDVAISVVEKKKGYYEYYKSILKKIKPKIIICVSAYVYERMVMIEAAKDLNIPVVELEHGIIGKYNVPYNFKRKRSLKSFPDYIFTFGRYDVEVPRYPIERERVCAVGSVELERNVLHYLKILKEKKKKKKIITVISGRNQELLHMINRLADILDKNKYKLIVKLHPGEYGNWRSIYPFLNKKDIQVVDDQRHNLYYYLAISDYVIGNDSTSLFEAVAFQTNILIYSVGSYTKSMPIVNKKRATLVNSEEDIKRYIEDERTNIYKDDYFFADNTIQKMNDAINRIIKGKY